MNSEEPNKPKNVDEALQLLVSQTVSLDVFSRLSKWDKRLYQVLAVVAYRFRNGYSIEIGEAVAEAVSTCSKTKLGVAILMGPRVSMMFGSYQSAKGFRTASTATSTQAILESCAELMDGILQKYR